MNIKKIKGFGGYGVSDTGVVFGKRFNRPMRPVTGHGGYRQVYLRKNGKYHGKRISRLVLETFTGPCPANKECNHINGIRDDDRLENLEWVTHSQNISHSFKIGNRCHKGDNHPMSKFKKNEVIFIRAVLKKKLLKPLFLAKMFGVTRTHIYDIQHYRRWKHI